MRVQPIDEKTASETAVSFAPWKAGEYDFTVYDASEEDAPSGGKMLKLTLHVFSMEGKKRTAFDYIKNDEKSAWKMRQFAKSIGYLAQYDRGIMDEIEICERSGRCKLGIKPAKGEYAANNKIDEYIAAAEENRNAPLPARQAATRAEARPRPAERPQSVDDLNDAIPF